MKRTVAVANVEAAPGTLATGFLRVGDLSDGCSPLHVPVMVFNGLGDGPTVYLHVGSHGQEPFYAIEAMRRLTRERLQADRLRGSLIIVPAANLLAYQAATRVAPQYAAREQRPFSGDLHRGWPGRADGTLTERLAHGIWTEIVGQSDYVIDYHSVSWPGIGFMYLYTGGVADRRGSPVWDCTLRLARATGLTVILTGQADTLAGACLDAGKPAIAFELPSPRMIREEAVESALQGTINVLAELAMVDEAPRPVKAAVLTGLHRGLPSLRANRGGIVTYTVEPGVRLAAGTVIARIHDVFGNELEAVVMPVDGYVQTFPPLSWVGAQMVTSGDWIADLFVEVDAPAREAVSGIGQ
jgi:predicted deacylase